MIDQPLRAATATRDSEDCASRRDFDSGDASRKQHHQSLAVSAPQPTAGLGQCRDDTVDDLILGARIAILVRDIDAVAADEPDPKHDRFHVPAQ
jgi:hypothetical protein